LHQVIG